VISIRRTCSFFARAYPQATLPAPTPDARPAFTRNYSGSEVQFGALDRLAARIAGELAERQSRLAGFDFLWDVG
jgi:hypothetical protein